jgi:hypothetical protein
MADLIALDQRIEDLDREAASMKEQREWQRGALLECEHWLSRCAEAEDAELQRAELHAVDTAPPTVPQELDGE